jgi:hypothetical protein
MRESYTTDIAPVVAERWRSDRPMNKDGSANTKQPNAPFRAQIARELFAQLPDEEQEAIRGRASGEAREAKIAYEKAMKQGPSKRPKDRQKCVL